MKLAFSPDLLPQGAVLLTCSSHEGRCRGLVEKMGDWAPAAAVLFHYDDDNPKREENHKAMEARLRSISSNPVTLLFTEGNAVESLRRNMDVLRNTLATHASSQVVIDLSVFTKRHLLMVLRWLDDEGYWDRLSVVYSEPEDYDTSRFIPLSFGLSSFQQIPGFSACRDLSRPVHLVLFLGYEGDRALAVYDHVQPMQTTLVVPHPPYKPSWIGRTEAFNRDLIALVGEKLIERVDAIDPATVQQALAKILGDGSKRGDHAKLVCPLGTKPQALGIYNYVRESADPPAVVYASPLRHNHEFFSYGIGNTWILKRAS